MQKFKQVLAGFLLWMSDMKSPPWNRGWIATAMARCSRRWERKDSASRRQQPWRYHAIGREAPTAPEQARVSHGMR